MTRIIDARNVNEALHLGTQMMRWMGVEKQSRNGTTLEVPEPVVTTFRRPWERVLFNAARDANPFFHFFEALWMLAGRNDIAFLTQFVKRMAEYSDNGVTQPGAYGFRWREHFGRDQLSETIELLRRNPDDRRVLIQQWDQSVDFNRPTKDACCNTQVMFKVRVGALHMSVTSRSHDYLWGAYGANAVHFSMLQEYVAAHIGARIGPMTFFSDSFHVYTTGSGGELWAKMLDEEARGELLSDVYAECNDVETRPQLLNTDMVSFDADLEKFFHDWDTGKVDGRETSYKHEYFKYTVLPMWAAHEKRNLKMARQILAPDWRDAAFNWLQRREKSK